eukprot:3680194-Rhodomonas_salina.2
MPRLSVWAPRCHRATVIVTGASATNEIRCSDREGGSRMDTAILTLTAPDSCGVLDPLHPVCLPLAPQNSSGHRDGEAWGSP